MAQRSNLTRKSTSIDTGDQLNSAVDAFLKDVKVAPVVRRRQQTGRIIFALDATMSRALTWRLARSFQADMFAIAQSMGDLEVQVVFFRGQGELRKSSWTHSPSVLGDRMARVQCRGGLTQIARVLRHAETEAQSHTVDALIYVGDAVEENPDVLADLAAKLALRNVKVFSFQEGTDPNVMSVFQGFARITRGAYASFDARSAQKLKALLEAVGAYAAGGISALQRLAQDNSAASAVLKQLSHDKGGAA